MYSTIDTRHYTLFSPTHSYKLALDKCIKQNHYYMVVMKRYFPFLVLSFLALSVVFSHTSYASRNAEVLGATTQISEVVFPPVTAGPGYILPSSPFYFADKLYQAFRLALVFTPENRAQLHTQIAAERLAELRVEISRNNKNAANSALTEVEYEVVAAANDLRDAASQGKDVTQLARTIHQTLTDYRGVLSDVRSQVPDTALGQQLAAAIDVIRESRIVAEDAMPQSDIEHELAANIEADVNEAVLGVADTTKKLEKKLSIYEKYASRAAERAAKKQEQETNRASISAQQKVIKAAREKAIQDYLSKIEALRKQREAELVTLKKTIKELQAQLKALHTSQNSGDSSDTTLTPTPTVTP